MRKNYNNLNNTEDKKVRELLFIFYKVPVLLIKNAWGGEISTLEFGKCFLLAHF
jgi:hypothetical protein